jgi:tetratricopeptide (TPR) repeat protein
MKISALMSDTDFNKLMNTILANTKNLYISYPAQNKWMVKKQREVEEDIHDDLLVGIATSVRNYSTLSPKVGSTGFQKALCTLERVVGVGEGADCGLFSLPVIWVSFLRLVREQKSEDWAWEFLLQALNLALNKFGREHSFVTVLLNLQKIWVKDPGQLEGVILKSYLCCIAHVKEMLGSFNLTYLTLWADYVVYLDGAATNKTNNVVEDIRGVIKVLEEEKGPDGGPDSDYILELLGLMLYVLQSAPTMATMANEAEEVAKDLYRRLERRKKKSGGKLEGDLLIKWKDLRQTLGTLCQERKDYDKAISFLEEFLSYEIADERDALALEKLERCYVAVGRDEKAMEVRELRMNESQRLLQKTDTEPFGGEKVVNDHRERDDEEGEDVSEGKGSSEGTVVGQVEEIQKENPKEYDTNETGDFEVEQQLLREQIAELEKKLHVLETSKGGKL